GNRARGLAAETRSRFSHQPPSDEVLAERVRSKLGRNTSHPGAIGVSVNDGIVTLRGDVLQPEVRDVMSCVYSLRDVADVHNELTTHADSTGVPGLQGDGESHKPGMLPKRSPAARMILGATGGALAVYGVTSHRRLGRTLGALGLGLLTTQVSTAAARRLGPIVSAAKD
ncbi:MAG: BON domain-containing protein, partial [Candidatus Acidiferrales bacterium]